MSTKTESQSADNESINLKHRITGAGVLIFFGVLVLPWLLGPPSEATKDVGDTDAQVENRHSTFEDEILAELEGLEGEQFEQPEETVYVSKITPLSGDPALSEPQLVETKVSKTKEAGDAADSTVETPVLESVSAPEVKNEVPTKEDLAKAQPKVTSGETKKPKIVSDTPKKGGNDTQKPRETTEVVKAPKIDVGWVVQVELLTDKKGANRLVSELKDKGFKPSTTVVDTNRGKNTGTRIWLGPFAQRAQAGTENDKLEAKMGKRGFIRVYP